MKRYPAIALIAFCSAAHADFDAGPLLLNAQHQNVRCGATSIPFWMGGVGAFEVMIQSNVPGAKYQLEAPGGGPVQIEPALQTTFDSPFGPLLRVRARDPSPGVYHARVNLPCADSTAAFVDVTVGPTDQQDFSYRIDPEVAGLRISLLARLPNGQPVLRAAIVGNPDTHLKMVGDRLTAYVKGLPQSPLIARVETASGVYFGNLRLTDPTRLERVAKAGASVTNSEFFDSTGDGIPETIRLRLNLVSAASTPAVVVLELANQRSQAIRFQKRINIAVGDQTVEVDLPRSVFLSLQTDALAIQRVTFQDANGELLLDPIFPGTAINAPIGTGTGTGKRYSY